MIEKEEALRVALFEGLASFHPRYEAEVVDTACLVDILTGKIRDFLRIEALLPEDAWAIVGAKTPLVCNDGHPVMFYDKNEALEWCKNIQGRPLRVHIVKRSQD